MRALLLAISISSSCIALAQDSLVKPHLLLTLNPISLVDVTGPPSLRVGMAAQLGARSSVFLEAGGFTPFYVSPFYYSEFSGYLAQVGSTFWYRDRADGFARGVTVSATFKDLSGSLQDSIKLDGIAPYQRTYDMHKQVVLLRLLMTERRHWTGRFWTELYYGVGLRYKHARTTGISAAELDARDFTETEDNDDIITPSARRAGELWLPDLIIGLRIGWRWK